MSPKETIEVTIASNSNETFQDAKKRLKNSDLVFSLKGCEGVSLYRFSQRLEYKEYPYPLTSLPIVFELRMKKEELWENGLNTFEDPPMFSIAETELSIPLARDPQNLLVKFTLSIDQTKNVYYREQHNFIKVVSNVTVFGLTLYFVGYVLTYHNAHGSWDTKMIETLVKG